MISLLFWLYDKKFALRLGGLVLTSAWLNEVFKGIFQVSRPPTELHKIVQGGYSFPSGHAQGSTSFWGYLALKRRKIGAYILTALLIVSVSLSRLYLGVHFPIDIVGGIIIGIGWLYVFELWRNKITLTIAKWQWYAGSLILTCLLLLTVRSHYSLRLAAFMLSCLWGYRLEADYVKFEVKGSWWQNTIKVVLGLSVIVLLSLSGPIILKIFGQPEPSTVRFWAGIFIRYFLIGIWVSLLAPFCFKALGLYPARSQ